MEQQKFKYKGKELYEPLNNLSVKIQERMKSIKSTIGDFEFKHSSIINNLSAIEKSVDPAFKSYNSLKREYDVLKLDLEKTINWIRECRRSPRACYVLDFQDLNWIYRH